MQQQRVVQNQRLKSLKTLHEQYSKSQADLGIVHAKQQANITGELKKEMSTLQKKMMDDAVSLCLKSFLIDKELCLSAIVRFGSWVPLSDFGPHPGFSQN